jgi:1-acyl-sn-glycerol-3-phosphate acyltransferase
VDLNAFAALDPAALRAMLPTFLGAAVADPARADAARAAVAALVAEWPPGTDRALLDHLAGLGEEPRLYPAFAPARAVSRAWCAAVLTDTHVEGIAHLRAAIAAGPTFLVGNHLSYFDSSAIDAVLAAAGAADLADRIVSLAGPKVYSDPFRRFATACLSTVPVPQSTQLGHTASLSPRELARQALAAIDAAHAAQRAGHALLVYAEGARTRTGRLQPFLPGVARYLKAEGARVVPFGLVGTQRIMPVGEARIRPGPVRLLLGAPLLLDDHGGARAALDAAHDAVRDLLPPELRPE